MNKKRKKVINVEKIKIRRNIKGYLIFFTILGIGLTMPIILRILVPGACMLMLRNMKNKEIGETLLEKVIYNFSSLIKAIKGDYDEMLYTSLEEGPEEFESSINQYIPIQPEARAYSTPRKDNNNSLRGDKLLEDMIAEEEKRKASNIETLSPIDSLLEELLQEEKAKETSTPSDYDFYDEIENIFRIRDEKQKGGRSL